ncbi:MAG: hypothetical protein QXR58_00065 [Candidatus Micrarchaeaceae archaeon]
MKETRKNRKRAEGKGINALPLYVLIVVMFALYILFQRSPNLSALFGIALFLLIIITIIIEIGGSVKEEGVMRSIVELVIAVAIVLVFWFGLKFALNTPYPLNVVPTCSMLPVLHRGDLVAIDGVSSVSQLHAPIVNVSGQEWNATLRNFSSEFLTCVAYNASSGSVSSIYRSGDELALYPFSGRGSVIPQNDQGSNLIRYGCGTAQVKESNGSVFTEAYTKSITIGNTTIQGDRNNSIVVYKTIPQDYFYQLGDAYIVHRVYAIVHAGNGYYILTKGDNNPGLDIQFGNEPILFEQGNSYIEGKVVLVVPYIGYLRLIFSRQLSEPLGCNTTILHS